MKNLYLLIILFSFKSISQTPVIDNSFNPMDNGGFQQYIGKYSVPLLNGKLLSVYYKNGITKIIRLNDNGSIDATFNFTDQCSSDVKIFAQSHGSFLTVFTNYETNSKTIKSYNADGSLNTNFISPTFNTGETAINTIVFQNDGKIILGGTFTNVNNLAYISIVRLNSDGSVDTNFAIGSGNCNTVLSIAMQNDGKYIVGGTNNTSLGSFFRLNSNGSLDNTFSLGIYSFANKVSDVVIQPDGKILASGGDFMRNGILFSGQIARFNNDGTRDASFFFNDRNSYVDFIRLQNDGKILFDINHTRIGRINSTGTIDNTFTDVNAASCYIENAFYLQSGKIIVNGNYNPTNGKKRYGIHRLNSNGSFDVSFNPHSGTNLLITNQSCAYNNDHVEEYTLQNPTVLNDGKILLLGNFTSYNDTPCKNICKLTEDGQIDPSFNIDPSLSFFFYNSQFSKIKQQNDGKILLTGGGTENCNGLRCVTILVNGVGKSFVRINENGSIDTSFNVPSNYCIFDYEIQGDGKIVAIGNGSVFMEGSRYKIIRLNSDGTLDPTLVSPLFYSPPTSLSLQTDNKILVTGNLTNYISSNDLLYRLSNNGSMDNTFNCLASQVRYTKLQSDGKILITYGFDDYFEGTSSNLRRLNSDGSYDNSFMVNSPSDTKIFITSQGKIIVKSNLLNHTFKVLNQNGGFESYFGEGFASSGEGDFTQIVQQNCDNIIVSGYFSKIDNIAKTNLVRYNLSNGTPIAPTGSTYQTFTTGQNLSNLVVNGENIQWYSTQNLCGANNADRNTNDVALPISTLLINGTTYYASQTINGIESTYRLPVTVYQTLGMNDTAIADLKLYPNPIQNTLTVTNSEVIDKIEIYSVMGQKIFEKDFSSTTTSVDFSNYSKGIYLIKIFSENKVQTNKLIKQ